MNEPDKPHKTFRKAKGKKAKKSDLSEQKARHNPRAFTFSGGANSATMKQQRQADVLTKKERAPFVDKAALVSNPPPFVVVVQGPPQSGKSTLIRSLVKHYTKQTIRTIDGPITVVASRLRRVTFIECPNDMRAMIDLGKIADLVLLTVDGSRNGFELETFEFLNILQIHGFPRVMGVLTHLDDFKENKTLRNVKKKFKHRFWTEIHDGAKMFYVSGLQGNKYNKTEVMNLARFIAVQKTLSLSWRVQHGYTIATNWEAVDVQDSLRVWGNPHSTPKFEQVLKDAPGDAVDLAVYGYVYGARLREGQNVHLPGIGDFAIASIDAVADPCPAPQALENKDFGKATGAQLRTLKDKHKSLYAPFCPNVGSLSLDASGMTIALRPQGSHFTKDLGEDSESGASEEELDAANDGGSSDGSDAASEADSDAVAMVRDMQRRVVRRDADFSLVAGGKPVVAEEMSDEEDDEEDEDDEDFAAAEQMPLEEDVVSDEKSEQVMSETKERFNGNSTVVDWQAFADRMERMVYSKPVVVEKKRSEDLPTGVLDLFGVSDDESDAEAPSKASGTLGAGVLLDSSKSRLSVFMGDLAELRLQKFFCAETLEAEVEEEVDEDVKTKAAEAGTSDQPIGNMAENTEGFGGDSEAGIGTYVRILLRGVAKESLADGLLGGTHRPLIVGGLASSAERREALLRVKVKKHRWFKKLLKSGEALMTSVGWYRYQSLPVFAIEDRNNVRTRYLKYTTEHMHSLCVVAGNFTPPGTGVLFVKRWDKEFPSFRVSGTGVVLESAEQVQVMKKLKLVGEPEKIQVKTAFIKNMFTSDLEVSKCVGARIQTVSGIRGEIKKAVGPNGNFRATFEDKIQVSDLIIMKTWTSVPISRFVNPLIDGVKEWRRIKTLNELRHEHQVPIAVKADSEYKTAKQERPTKDPQVRMKVSRKLMENLPFKTKAKVRSELLRGSEKDSHKKAAVVRSKDEKEIAALLQRLNIVKKDKQDKREVSNKARLERKQKADDVVQKLRDEHTKENKKRKYALDGKKELDKRKKMKL
jgi:ribosome biogenesis protein BMS1